MKCTDCLHYDICLGAFGDWLPKICESFKDKAKYLELPCSIGDAVYTIVYHKVHEAKVTCIRPFVFDDHTEFRGNAVVEMEDPFFIDGRLIKQEPFIIFGKDTFLTREEAEKKLEELK